MTVKKDRRIESQLRDSLGWDAARGAKRETKVLAEFQEEIEQKNLASAVSSLSLLAINPLFPRGQQRLTRGDAGGWGDIERGGYYNALSVVFNKGAMLDAGTSLAQAMVLGDVQLARWLADAITAGASRRPRAWSKYHLPSFALALYRRWVGAPEGPLPSELGVYREVLEAWDDTDRLAQALMAACEFHIESTLEDSETPEEFSSYYLIPIELAALRVVREKEGKAMPPLEHPLLSTPYARVPGPPARYHFEADPLVQQVFALAREQGKLPQE